MAVRWSDGVRSWLRGCLLLAVFVFAVCGQASARETVALTQGSVTDPAGHSARLGFSATIASTPGSAPSAITQIDLLAPLGTTLDLERATTCPQPVLEMLGPEGCPRSARAGHGSGLTVSRFGGKIVEQPFTFELLLTENRPGQPGLLGLLSEHEPFEIEQTFTGTVLPAPRPYGLEARLDMPVVPVYPGVAPEASTQSIRIAVGENPAHGGGLVLSLPRTCPRGGWALASRFTFQDGTSASGVRRAPCRAG